MIAFLGLISASKLVIWNKMFYGRTYLLLKEKIEVENDVIPYLLLKWILKIFHCLSYFLIIVRYQSIYDTWGGMW